MDRDKTDWLLIGLLWALGLLAAGQFAKVALALEALGRSYPGAPLPLAVSALSITGIVFGVTAGVIVARLGLSRALIGAMALGAVASLAQALLPPFPVLLALRLLEGVAHLGIVVAAPTAMAMAASPRDEPVAMGLWGTFFSLGFALWAVVVGVLPDPSAGFVLHAVALVALALPLWRRLPPSPPVAQDRMAFVARHLEIYRAPRLVAPALGFFWHTALFLGLLTFLPGFVGGWTAPLLPLVALVGTFGAGLAARRIAPRAVMMTGFALSLLGLAVLLAVPEEARGAVALCLIVVIGIVPGGAFAAVPALNQSRADRARANGAMAQLGNVGTGVSVPLMAATLGAGLTGPVAVAAVLSALGLGVVWLIHRKIA
ncbi:MFS transporter [Histidinibacterium lentulum]|uniref:MFS transporter n=1 Tax=Histidinibacterium lentulum TaxID=2480588 RepID=A0A3N2R9P4_9RHOB|nr:MFS transporter [Histidinibacterium lentulum]ROU04143.1 MFS transporter [Histidinibacterium lentulum]